MRCLACGAQNADSLSFCEDCGSPLGVVCANCGESVSAGKRFCGHCGQAIDVGAPSTDAGLLAQVGPAADLTTPERRLVSVLFADLVGFTTLSESRDTEEVRELLSRYYDVCRAAVDRYGGSVDKFVGDGLLAVWGIPVTHEDDAERAVRCALDLVDEVSVLGAETGNAGLAARAAVMTGEVAVALGDERESILAGDLVNTASRLQGVSEARSVLVGETTFLASDGAIAYSAIGELSLKGKDEPVLAWRALRVVAKRGGAGRPEIVEAPFVGRDAEMQVLKEALNALAIEPRARLVSVTGVPGIGKSRLSWELLKYVDGLAGDIFWHHGRSPAYGEGISFWALAEMVRMRAGILEDEDTRSAKAKLAQSLAEFVPEEQERSWIEPRLAHLIGVGDAPMGLRDETFSAWRSFFEHIASEAPVVMVFEDLQWADTGLVDFIESVLEWSRSHAILVITLARPEFLERRPNWGAAQRNFTSMHLEPLSEDTMAELLGGLVRDLSAKVRDQILERAEGIPLYAVEIVRMLSSKGFLSEHDGVYEVSSELGELELPDTLQALVASRLDAIPKNERSLLQDASVLGKSFTVAGLASLSGSDPASLEEPLHDLVRKELLSFDNDPRSPERGQYGFVQGLIREVAYGALARKDRLRKHLAAAQYFEASADDELSGVIAAHYLQAYRAAPDGDERVSLGERAQGTLVAAGRRALSLGSTEQALSYFEQALEVQSAGSQEAAIRELAGEAADRAASPEIATAHLDRAIQYYEQLGDRVSAGRVAAAWAHAVYHAVEDYPGATERTEQALAAMGDEGEVSVRATLTSRLARLHEQVGDWTRAYELAEIALPLVEKIDDPELLTTALRAKAIALDALGRHQEAVILNRGVLAVAESAGVLVEQSAALSNLANQLTGDDPREALVAHVRARELSRRCGDRIGEAVDMMNICEGAFFLGEWDQAADTLQELDERELSGSPRLFRAGYKALLRAARGDVTAARVDLAELSSTFGASESVYSRSTYATIHVFVCLLAGDSEQAYEEADAALAGEAAGNARQLLSEKARAALWMRDLERTRHSLAQMDDAFGRRMVAIRLAAEAGLAALEGRTDEAVATFEETLRRSRELRATLDVALCELDMALLLGSHPAGEEAAVSAGKVFSALDAVPFLELLRERGPAVYEAPEDA